MALPNLLVLLAIVLPDRLLIVSLSSIPPLLALVPIDVGTAASSSIHPSTAPVLSRHRQPPPSSLRSCGRAPLDLIPDFDYVPPSIFASCGVHSTLNFDWLAVGAPFSLVRVSLEHNVGILKLLHRHHGSLHPLPSSTARHRPYLCYGLVLQLLAT